MSETLSSRIGQYVGAWVASVARPDAELAPTTEWESLMREVDAFAADLEAVRRVEAFQQDPKNYVVFHDGHYTAITQDRSGHYVQLDRVARGDSLVALGRALGGR